MTDQKTLGASGASLFSVGLGAVTFRMLKLNEPIQKTDESLNDDCETWSPVNRWAVGMGYDSRVFVPVRRREVHNVHCAP